MKDRGSEAARFKVFAAQLGYHSHPVGAWRSLVAHLHGVQGVASSNLVAPTNYLLGGLAQAVPFDTGLTDQMAQLGSRQRFRMNGIIEVVVPQTSL